MTPRIVQCFCGVRVMTNRRRSGQPRYVAELWSRGTSTLMYSSKPCDNEDGARDLLTKYLARRPEYEVCP